jgi:hypothetical protein
VVITRQRLEDIRVELFLKCENGRSLKLLTLEGLRLSGETIGVYRFTAK